MKTTFAILLALSFFFSSLSYAKWVDPEAEANKYRKHRAWKGVDFTVSGFSSSAGTSAITYRHALNDIWEWNAGTGIDSLGWFFTGGGRYFVYNWPRTTCFFAFACHGQVSGGANLNYANGGRKTFTNAGVDSVYDQGNSISLFPTVAFRSIYNEFFSLTLDVGYRIMVQKPNIRRSFGPANQSNVDDLEKSSKNDFGASVAFGIVF